MATARDKLPSSVGYRSKAEAGLAVEWNLEQSLPRAEHLSKEDRTLSVALEPHPPLVLPWSMVWPPAQRHWLKSGMVTQYVGTAPPATKDGVTKEYERELGRAIGVAAALQRQQRMLRMSTKAAKKAAKTALKNQERKAWKAAKCVGPAAKIGKNQQSARKKDKAGLPPLSLDPLDPPQHHDPPPHPLPPPSPPLILRPVDYFYAHPSLPSWAQPTQPVSSHQQPPQPFANNQGYSQ